MQNENTASVGVAPTQKSQRINSIDVLRGVSLLGILLMNITGFGLYNAYMDPTVNGGSEGWSLNVFMITSMFFEGTMRAIFSMLFGVGIILFTQKTNAGTGSEVTDLFFRRLWWLFLFGIIHCYLLLWNGEILYAYAIVGMFAFSFRHLKPKLLIGFAALFIALITLWEISDYHNDSTLYKEATEAQLKKDKGETLSKEETASIEAWKGKLEKLKPSPEKVKEEIEANHQDYLSIVMHKVPENQWSQTTFLYRYNFLDVLAMMLLGMALFKMQILTMGKSRSFYLKMILIGYTFGLLINYWELNTVISGNFSILALGKSFLTYQLGRIGVVFGHIGVIMLFLKTNWLLFLQKSLAAVGQMALTNYISHSIICNVIYLGMDYYGMVQRYELYYVVFGIWIFQLIISPIWLKHFYFGPMEWIWRCLTYWKKQPFKKPYNQGELAA